MNDSTELLDRLDRRATRARAEIDRALDDVEVPVWGEPSDRRQPRTRLLVAAALVIVAIGGVLFIGRDDREPTVAGPGGITVLGLPDPAAEGYEVVTAFDATSTPRNDAVTGSASVGASGPGVLMHGPVAADDPWSSVIIETLHPGSPDPDGESIDLGETMAVFTESPMGATVGWQTSQGVRTLTAPHLGRDELIVLAEKVLDQDAEIGQALPDHSILLRGSMADLVPVAVLTADPIPGTAAVAYGHQDAPEKGFAVHVTQGSSARWRAASALATTTRRATVRGRDAVLATTEYDDQSDEIVSELSWLEPDGTLVRVSWIGDRDLTGLANQLEPIPADEFATMVREHAVTQQSPTTIDAAATPLGNVSLLDGTTQLDLRLQDDPEGGLGAEFEATTSTGVSGAGLEVESLETNIALLLPEHRAVGGVLGPALDRVAVFDSATGAPIEVLDFTIGHSEHTTYGMFIAVLDVDRGAEPVAVDVVGTLDDGSTVRVTTEG